ncbi:MAG: hypothetical protein PHD19_11530 [Dechloromonas sp.]|nr:hypothetical protein [Dechloromonas sp.]
MSKKTEAAAAEPLAESQTADEALPVAAPIDLYAGQGGSYVVDPKTGVRTLVERTEHVAETGGVNQK